MTDAPDDAAGDAVPDAQDDAAGDAGSDGGDSAAGDAAADGRDADASPGGGPDEPPTHAVVDLDGTVYRGDDVIADAAAALERLRAAGVGVTFLSNDATRTRATYRRTLSDLGVWRDGDGIVTAASVTAAHLAATWPDAGIHVLGSDGLREELRDAGLAPDAAPADADVLVVSMDRGLSYERLDDALRAARAAGEGRFVATNRDPTCPTPTGERPGTGAIVAAVAAAVEREPDVVCGKPGPAMVRHLRDRLEDPAGTLMVGDRPGTDVATGRALGARTALVLSGASARADLDALDAYRRPDRVAPTLAALVDELLS